MSRDALGGGALVLGAALGLATMALHPSGVSHALTPEQLASAVQIGALAHGLGIASLAVTFLGALGLTRQLADGPSLAALVAYGFAAVAGMCAATINGFVMGPLLRHLADADAAQRAALDVIGDYSWFLNQGFAKVLVTGSSAAIACWSLALWRARPARRGLAVFGGVAGLGAIAALLAGALPLNVHGFGLVVLVQSIWFVWTGFGLSRAARPAGSPP
jgi:hypothetical protein